MTFLPEKFPCSEERLGVFNWLPSLKQQSTIIVKIAPFEFTRPYLQNVQKYIN